MEQKAILSWLRVYASQDTVVNASCQVPGLFCVPFTAGDGTDYRVLGSW